MNGKAAVFSGFNSIYTNTQSRAESSLYVSLFYFNASYDLMFFRSEASGMRKQLKNVTLCPKECGGGEKNPQKMGLD